MTVVHSHAHWTALSRINARVEVYDSIVRRDSTTSERRLARLLFDSAIADRDNPIGQMRPDCGAIASATVLALTTGQHGQALRETMRAGPVPFFQRLAPPHGLRSAFEAAASAGPGIDVGNCWRRSLDAMIAHLRASPPDDTAWAATAYAADGDTKMPDPMGGADEETGIADPMAQEEAAVLPSQRVPCDGVHHDMRVTVACKEGACAVLGVRVTHRAVCGG